MFLPTNIVAHEDDQVIIYEVKFVNTLILANMPPHRMVLKVSVLIILLHNLNR